MADEGLATFFLMMGLIEFAGLVLVEPVCPRSRAHRFRGWFMGAAFICLGAGAFAPIDSVSHYVLLRVGLASAAIGIVCLIAEEWLRRHSRAASTAA